MLTVLDLFSGIGGISLGLESTGGFKTIGFCEIEPFPRAVLRKHWPEVPIHDDVRRLTADSLGGLRPDVICGGFPCQDISVAGKGAGLDGKRSGLWSEYARLVGELRPRWVIAENVGALRTRGVDRVCADLEGEGYTVWPLLVGAWAAGAPHRRERVWIVAHSQGRASGEPEARYGRAGTGRGGASELSNSDAGRRGGSGDEVQAGRDEPERTASGVGLADPYERRRATDGRGGVQHGERAAQRDDADGRGERPVGEPTGSGLEGQRADAGGAEVTQPRHAGALPQPEGERRAQQGDGRDAGSRLGCDGPRWPARPGEPQHEWECSRLAHASQPDAAGRAEDERRGRGAEGVGGDGAAHAGESGGAQQPVGGAVDGLPERLVRLAKLRLAERHARRHNRESLKAYGNSVVPAVVAAIGQAILEAEARLV